MAVDLNVDPRSGNEKKLIQYGRHRVQFSGRFEATSVIFYTITFSVKAVKV